MDILKILKKQDGQIMMVVSLMLMIGLTVSLSIFLDSYSTLSKTRSEERGEASVDLSEAAIESVLLQEYSDIRETSNQDGAFLANLKVTDQNSFEAQSVQKDTVVNVDLSGSNVTKVAVLWVKRADPLQDPCSFNQTGQQAVLFVEKWGKTTVTGTPIPSPSVTGTSTYTVPIVNGRYSLLPFNCDSSGLNAPSNSPSVLGTQTFNYLAQNTVGTLFPTPTSTLQNFINQLTPSPVVTTPTPTLIPTSTPKVTQTASTPTPTTSGSSSVKIVKASDAGYVNVLDSSLSNYMNYQVITVNFNDLYLRIRPLYNTTDILVVADCSGGSTGCSLPPQQKQIKAVPVPEGQQEIRAVQIDRYNNSLPEIFDYVLFTGQDLVKQK